MSERNGALVLVNGRIWQGIGSARAEAIAIQRGRIAAVGSTAEVRERFGDAEELDLGGRTVIPGLVDGHAHSVRGGVNWTRELDWSRVLTPEAAIASLEAAVAAALPGQWVAAVGGWHASQFGGWAPERALLDRIAPDTPVYVQSLYEFGVANSAALREASVTADETGRVEGMPAYNAFLAAMGDPSDADQRAGLLAMYRDFAAVGLTGVTDPGGFLMSYDRYKPVFELWREGALPLRLRLFFSAVTPGREVDEVRELLATAFQDPGDDWLRAVGLGEVLQFGCHDFEGIDTTFAIDDVAAGELEQVTRLAAAAGIPIQLHGMLETSISRILDVWERVDRDIPLADLRFSLAHGDQASASSVARMKRLGVGVIVDDHQVYRAEASVGAWGADGLATVPPLGAFRAAGIPVGAGTDATRASTYDPWRCLHWLVAGRPFAGVRGRDAEHLLTIEQALDVYSRGNAWFTREEGVRGRLEPGWFGDLAVLDRDVLAGDADALLGTVSELTVVGGRVAYSSGAVADPV